MQLFLKKMGLFLLLFALISFGGTLLSTKETWNDYFAHLTKSEEYLGESSGFLEINPCIERVQKKDKTKVLITGDSVCNQMFSGLREGNEEICIVGSNGAITMAGQYLLVKEYLNNHDNITDIYMILNPGSLTRTFDTDWAYQYLIMPFGKANMLQELDSETLKELQKVYGKAFLQPRIIEILNDSAVARKLYLNLIKKHKEGYYPDNPYEIADLYIGKIYELCQEKNIDFYLVSSPVSDGRREEMEDMEAKYQNTWLQKTFPQFFQNILYFPAEQAQDTTHFSGEYANQSCYNEKIKIMFAGHKLLEQLKMVD